MRMNVLDIINRSRLRKSIMREATVEVGGEAYIRLDAVLEKINMEPSADAVEVVRCGKCAKAKKFHNPQMGDLILCNEYRVFTDECGFCHKGAKMDGGAE